MLACHRSSAENWTEPENTSRLRTIDCTAGMPFAEAATPKARPKGMKNRATGARSTMPRRVPRAVSVTAMSEGCLTMGVVRQERSLLVNPCSG